MTGWKLVEGSKLSQWKALYLNSRCAAGENDSRQMRITPAAINTGCKVAN